MRAAALVLLFAAGCRSLLGIDDPILADGGGDDGAGCASFSRQLDTCALSADGDASLAGDIVFDTDTGTLTVGGTPLPVPALMLTTSTAEIVALVVADFTLDAGAHLRAVGSRPFGIVASGTITLHPGAVIDVGSGGAGARSDCGGAAPTAGQNATGGAGGGGGAGFQAAGGNGGIGNADGVQSLGGTNGDAQAFPGGPLGGCTGARGGNDDTDSGGAGGLGGGAVYLVAATSITLDAPAAISAAGGGGAGGQQHANFDGDAGGGGGGSGGMILLEAPLVQSDGTLAANGGGGGEGSGGINSGNDGAPGTVGETRAAGGRNGSLTGSDGGQGGARTELVGDSVTESSTGGAGGGGGGAGFVRIESAELDQNGVVSPAAI